MRLLFLGVLALLAAAACDMGVGTGGLGQASALPDWRLAQEPRVQIGVPYGDERYLLSDVVSGVLLPDGRIVAAEINTPRLRFYDQDGQHLHDVGGRGEGPGEFQILVKVAPYRGDSLVAYDMGLRRLSIFDRDGRFVRSVQVPPMSGRVPGSGWVPDQSCCALAGVTREGAFVFLLPAMIPIAGQSERWSQGTIVRLAEDGSAVDTLAVRPSQEFVSHADSPYGVRVVHHSGLLHAVATGEHGFVGNGVSYETEVLGSDGAQQSTIRVDRDPVPVTPELRRMEMEELLDRYASEPARLDVVLEMRDVRWAEHLPAYTRLRTDDEGNVWVFEPSVPGTGDPPIFTILRPDGTALGRLPWPTAELGQPLHLGRDAVLTVATDSLGVPSLRVYDLERGEGGME